MTKRELAALSCKVLGIFFFLRALQLFGQRSIAILSLLPGNPIQSQEEFIITAAWSLIALIAPLLLVLFLWFKSDWCAKKIFPDDGECETLVIQTNFVAMALTVIGILAVLWSAPHLISNGILTILSKGEDSQRPNLYTGPMLASLFQTLFGIWLAFGAAKLAGILGTIDHVTQDNNA